MRILLVTNHVPWPVHHGGSQQRTHMLWQALRECGDVDYLLISWPDKCTEDELAQMRRDYRLVAHFPWPRPTGQTAGWRLAGWLPARPPLRGIVRNWIEAAQKYRPSGEAAAWLAEQQSRGGYDLIVGRYLRPTLVSGAAEGPLPLILDVDDVESEKVREQLRAAEHPSVGLRILWRGQSQWLRRIERRVFRQVDHAWFVSPEDRARFGGRRASVLPNIPFVPPGGAPQFPIAAHGDSHEMLFVGHLGYEPNREGLKHFLEKVFVRVRAAEPEARLRIVGVGVQPEDLQRWQNVPGVEVSGFLDRLDDAYRRAAFCVVPVYYGAGTKIKVLESLAYGRACVLTPHALYGYRSALRHGESLWCGETDEKMAEGCLRLIRDPDFRASLAARGRQVIAEQFTFERFRRIVHQTLAEVLDRRRRSSR